MTRAWAPGRVNIIGEHTDYNDGLVLPMAIHFGVTATVRERHGDRVTVTSVQRRDEAADIALDELEPGRIDGWAAYAAGALWSLGVDHGIPAGVEIVIDGDVPLGAGLSSSAAVECAVVMAAANLFGVDADKRTMASWAQRAENDFVGVPTGSMDQVASMMSVAGHALLFDIEADTTTPVAVSLPGLSFMVIDTKAHHSLVDGGYADRRRSCERAAALLGLPSLRRVTDLDLAFASLKQQPDGDVLVRRVRHVVSENARVERAVDALATGDVAALGDVLDQSHGSLRDDYEVSCPELDVACEAARSAGAVGARMTGGGFGGSAVALVPDGAWSHVARDVKAAFTDHGWAEPGIIGVKPGGGARILV